MKRGALRTLTLAGGPVARGRAHGAACRDAIRAYTDERVRLAAGGVWAGRPMGVDEVLALARSMLPAHRDYSPGLYAELCALAEAAGTSPEEAVVVGGFTDLVDAVRAAGASAVEEDDCTAMLVPGARAGDGQAIFAQTWDMHESATDHVLLLDLQPDDGPAALVFSTAGCLGQIGLNEVGISIGITNLVSTDGRPGVTWPFVVREVLAQSTLEAAAARLRAAPLAGGHSYLLLDGEGRGLLVESSARRRVEWVLQNEPLLHTNHCLAPEIAAVEAERDAGLLASSVARLGVARELLRSGTIDVPRLMALTAEPSAVCRHGGSADHIETSGAAIIRPATRELWACWGPPDHNSYVRYEVSRG